MEVKDYLKLVVGGARRYLNGAIDETPQEIVNVKVGETNNTIAAVYAHVVGGEDYFVNLAIQGKPRLWESEWAAQLGITAQLGRNWEFEIPDLAAFREYAKAVHAATDAYIETVTPDELERKVQVFSNERPVANVLSLIVTHASAHAGEIATLKAMQGVKGLPF
jgi:uncharacterized damage-inducible protein DinB